MNLPRQQLDGALLSARYAFMPNKLRYCGGDDNKELFGYVTEKQSDNGLKELLKEFATMYPYLRLIADANKIIDPFNYKVVEAYWIGNDLLNNVGMSNFYNYMVDKQQLKKTFKPKTAELIFGKIPLGAKPHHSWHVFNIPKRTGHFPIEHTLETMDKCRIGWGKIEKIENLGQGELIKKITIDYKPLVIRENKVELGSEISKEVWIEFDNKSFIVAPQVGKWVSIHWEWACDYLTDEQVQNLEKWTLYNLRLANVNI